MVSTEYRTASIDSLVRISPSGVVRVICIKKRNYQQESAFSMISLMKTSAVSYCRSGDGQRGWIQKFVHGLGDCNRKMLIFSFIDLKGSIIFMLKNLGGCLNPRSFSP